jgi:hypothetical protein
MSIRTEAHVRTFETVTRFRFSPLSRGVGRLAVVAQLKLNYVLASACTSSLRAAIPSFG